MLVIGTNNDNSVSFGLSAAEVSVRDCVDLTVEVLAIGSSR
jgi:hypothetical protein